MRPVTPIGDRFTSVGKQLPCNLWFNPSFDYFASNLSKSTPPKVRFFLPKSGLYPPKSWPENGEDSTTHHLRKSGYFGPFCRFSAGSGWLIMGPRLGDDQAAGASRGDVFDLSQWTAEKGEASCDGL